MEEAKLSGKEIHVRSVFFQGLFFKKVDELTGNLRAFAKPLEHFQSIIQNHGKTAMQACLNYALHQPFVDRVIIGVETVQQLEQNIRSLLDNCPEWILRDLDTDLGDRFLLNPSNWKP